MTSLAIKAEGRTLPLVTHVLMLLSIVTGATGLVAVMIAYMSMRGASDEHRSHYAYVIRTFWVAMIALVALFAFAWSFVLFPFSFLPVYGRLLYLLISLWIIVRSTVGIMRLTGGEGISNPNTLFLPKKA